MYYRTFLKIICLTAALSAGSVFSSYADLILDAPDLSGTVSASEVRTEQTKPSAAAENTAAGIVISDRPTELVPETKQAAEPETTPVVVPPVSETAAGTAAEPETETKAAESETETGEAETESETDQVGPVVSDVPNAGGEESGKVTGIESAPLTGVETPAAAEAPAAETQPAASAQEPAAPSVSSQRVYLDFEVASPAHSLNGSMVTRASVQLSNGTWQNFTYTDHVRYPYYRIVGRGTDGNGNAALIAAAGAMKFGDAYTNDGEMKGSLYLNAADCSVKNYIDINTGSTKRAAIVKVAFSMLGKRYTYGGNGPDAFDCSGLVKAVMANAGIDAPRTSTSYLSMAGQISESELRPGDVLARAGHCGIYVGGGIFIHASDSGIGVVAEYLSVYNTVNKFTNCVNVVGD